MSSTQTSRGFTIVEGVMIFIALAIVAALGFALYNTLTKKSPSAQSSQEIKKESQQNIPTVNSAQDLDKVTTDLDKIDVTSADEATELNEQQTSF